MMEGGMVRPSTIAAIRFGYGFHSGEAPPAGAEALLAGLRAAAGQPPVFEIAGPAERRARLDGIVAARKAGAADPDMKRMRRAMHHDAAADGAARILQRALGPSGFFERLVEFWADHFSVAARNSGQAYLLPVFEVEAIRPHVGGRFGDMLVAVVQHPAMLNYLDQSASFGPGSPAGRNRGSGLNENLARELLELHTLGAGGPYTQADVRQLAELLTGYGVRRGYEAFRFVAGRAEPGAETVLGRSYGGGPADAGDAAAFLQDLARHPATARHLARKLAVHFVADDPEPALVDHVAAAWQRTGGELLAVYGALVEHPAAWQGFGAKVKRPLDLVVSTLRAAGLDRAGAAEMRRGGVRLLRTLRRLGQPLYGAPGPDGWPEAAGEWITPQGLASRLEFAGQAAHRIAADRGVDPRRFAEAALGDALRPETAWAAGAAAERWEGIALVLASPEFNRR